jgi:hypothetical protein
MPEINPTDLLETFEGIAAQKSNGTKVTAEAATAKMLTRMAKQIEDSDVLKSVEKAQVLAEHLRTLAAAIQPDEPTQWTRASLRAVVSMLDLAVQMGYLSDDEQARLEAAKAVVFAPRKASPAIEGRPEYVIVYDMKDGGTVLHRRASTASAPKHLVAALAAAGFTGKAAQEALLSVVMGEKDSATGGGITAEATEVAPRRGRKAR